MKKIKAVITADVVNSSLLTREQMHALKETIEKILDSGRMRYSFYRGDSFNAVCETSEALKVACLLRTLAIQSSDEEQGKQIDIRIAIGLGTVEEPFAEMSSAKGDAFILSGREMDRMEKEGPRLLIRCTDVSMDACMEAVALFADFILKKLTVKQAEVIFELLHGFTQVKVAKKLQKTQSTVNKHASAANWKELVKLIEIYQRLTLKR